MELPRRNGAAVEQALRQMITTIEEQQIRINGLINTMSSFSTRIEQLEQIIARQRIASLGRGPTEVTRGDYD